MVPITLKQAVEYSTVHGYPVSRFALWRRARRGDLPAQQVAGKWYLLDGWWEIFLNESNTRNGH